MDKKAGGPKPKIYKYKGFKFWVYARKKTQDFVVSQATKGADPKCPPEVLAQLTRAARLYYTADFQALDITDFLDRVLGDPT